MECPFEMYFYEFKVRLNGVLCCFLHQHLGVGIEEEGVMDLRVFAREKL